MPFDTLVGGLELVIPTNGTRNWGTILRNSTWTKINNHQHTGSGDGNRLTGASFVDGSISKTQLNPNQSFVVQPSPVGIPDVSNVAEVDFNSGNNFKLDISTATGNVDLQLSNPIEGARYFFKIVQGATLRNVLWAIDIKWPQGEEPTQYMEALGTAGVWLDYIDGEYLGRWEIDY